MRFPAGLRKTLLSQGALPEEPNFCTLAGERTMCKGWGDLDRKAFFTALAVLAVAALGLLALRFAFVLLLAFAGVLLAVLLRNLAAALSRDVPLPVAGALAVVVIGIAAAIGLFAVLAGTRVTAEILQVAERVPAAWKEVRAWLSTYRWGGYLLEAVPSAAKQDWNFARVLGPSVSMVIAVTVNVVVVMAVGVFLAADPALYRRGLLHLVPKRARPQAREVLDAMGHGLWRWLIGQGIDMAAVALMTGAGLWLIGVQTPVTLGLIAGITNFIPYVGPFIGGVPVVLAALSQSPDHALYALGMMIAIQQIDGHVLMPLIQKRTSSLPPALTILAVLALGSVFGIAGMLLATPLLVTGLIAVQMLYVEEVLEDDGIKDAIR